LSDVQPSIEDFLARLERERLEADRRYNAALTAVDEALRPAPDLPAPPPSYDASRLPDANRGWNILPGAVPAFDGSFKGRLGRFIWRLVGPALESQQRFNSAVVDHLNRNAAAHAARADALASTVGALEQELRDRVRFESLLVQYLQTITEYVDTKDRSLGGAEIRQRLALTEQRLLALKRDVERAGGPGSDALPNAQTAAPTADADAAFTGSLDSLTYVAFEDQFRGDKAEIRRRVEDYVPIFAGASNVVDVGCGRGELLDALREKGISARGVDVSPAMVEMCRARGFDVELGDALEYVRRQPDASVGGLIAIQVVEHFAPAYLTRFLEAAFHAMRPGGKLVLETINPACWMAFFETYIRDLTHRQPLHPETLRHLVQASGFSSVDVQYRAPVSAADRLERAAAGTALPPDVAAVVAAVNDHADKLNARLFSSMDYVVVATR
jgi:O-antigen chain-terminating methyltransferase